MYSSNRPAHRLATRLLFLVAGFGYACWAPLVPFVKVRLNIDDHTLGLLLLCLGSGSIVAMVAAGMLANRFSSRPVIIVSGVGFAFALALLPISHTILALGVGLAFFGAALGALDVTMNMHAVDVEREEGKSMMSGFHAHFSIGGFAGAATMTASLSFDLGIKASTLICCVLILSTIAFAAPRLLVSKQSESNQFFAIPRGIVLLIGVLAAITFLVEGALLDWGALLLTESDLVPVAQGGLGYMLFSVAMTVGRLSGDAVCTRIGDRNTLVLGGIVGFVGMAILLLASTAIVALTGFALIGLGCSNIVPVFFRRAGAQTFMPQGLAIAAVSTTAYAGILVGPAGIGFLAKSVGLHTAFWMLAALFVLVPLCANVVTTSRKQGMGSP